MTSLVPTVSIHFASTEGDTPRQKNNDSCSGHAGLRADCFDSSKRHSGTK